MKKVICKIEYDTDASELIQKKVYGVFGDPKGYEESLYPEDPGPPRHRILSCRIGESGL